MRCSRNGNRRAARKLRRANAIRKELAEKSILIEDCKSGARWKRK